MWSPDPLLRQVLQQDLLPHEGTVLAAVSGGADSMCLLHLLLQLAPEYGFTLAVAHYHHGLRGEEADQDAAFVRTHSRALGLPFYTEQGDVRAHAAAHGLGIEEAARQLRYGFLEVTAEAIQTATGLPCWIATAHNANDNAETLLLHLVRGTGLQGLTGIPPRRGRLLRPLLPCTRAEIQTWNQQHGIPFVEDSTNADPTYSRNYLRHRVLPLLEVLNPNLVQSMNHTAQSLTADHSLLEEQTASALQACHVEGGTLSVPLSTLTDLPQPLRARAVQQLYARLCPGEILSRSHREAVLALCFRAAPSGTCSLPGGIEAQRVYQQLLLRPVQAAPTLLPVTLPLPGQVQWGAYTLTAASVLYQGEQGDAQTLYLRCDQSSLTVRPRRVGDSLTLPGRPTKTVKKWMIDQKLPCHLRNALPVLTAGEGPPLAVAELGTAVAARPEMGEPAWCITLYHK